MPILNRLDFVRRDLHVAYQARPEPQRLTIDVTTAGPNRSSAAAVPPAMVETLVNAGAAGGADFAPSAGSYKKVKYPTKGQRGGVDQRFVVEIAAVCPLAIRLIVERLRLLGGKNDVLSMSIVGDAPARAGLPAFVTGDDVRAWLESPTAYPGEWSDPAFPVRQIDVAGFSASIVFAKPVTPKVGEELTRLGLRLATIVADFACDADGRTSPPPAGLPIPDIVIGKADCRILFSAFRYAPVASRAVCVNLLAKLHATVAPIAEVEIGFPDP